MAKIKFIRKCQRHGTTQYDIIYQSGRSNLFLSEKNIPQTAKDYILNAIMAGTVTEQVDRYHGPETIYEYNSWRYGI